MSYSTAIRLLTAAGIEFTTQSFFNGFCGNRIIFKTRKIAMKALKVIGENNYSLSKYFKEYAIEFYN